MEYPPPELLPSGQSGGPTSWITVAGATLISIITGFFGWMVARAANRKADAEEAGKTVVMPPLYEQLLFDGHKGLMRIEGELKGLSRGLDDMREELAEMRMMLRSLTDGGRSSRK